MGAEPPGADTLTATRDGAQVEVPDFDPVLIKKAIKLAQEMGLPIAGFEVLADGGTEPGVTVVELDLTAIADARRRVPAWRHDPVIWGP